MTGLEARLCAERLLGQVPRWKTTMRSLADAPTQTGYPMRLFIPVVAAVVIFAVGYTIKAKMFPSSTSLMTAASPVATTLSPHEIHLNYKGMKDLPVHDSTNAN
jgi:hypothetical protein